MVRIADERVELLSVVLVTLLAHEDVVRLQEERIRCYAF